ncbi:MAG: HAD family hydrolase [Verrucomicrobiaceae bacterium]|nr:MAG: HAD family hydrolase [Verrucomicrobiaceae bacterium]
MLSKGLFHPTLTRQIFRVKYGLIFDLDGTLVDSLRGISGSLNHALSQSGLPNHPIETVRGFIGNGARLLIERAASPAEGEDLYLTLEEAFKTHYDVSWPEGTAPYLEIVEMLEFLQTAGHPLAVLSNKPHEFTETIVKKLFPSVTFAAVLGQRAGIPHKPDPAGALEIAKVFGLDASQCALIGDSTMDIETAQNAGMASIAVTWGFQDHPRLVEARADLFAHSPAELLEIIGKL